MAAIFAIILTTMSCYDAKAEDVSPAQKKILCKIIGDLIRKGDAIIDLSLEQDMVRKMSDLFIEFDQIWHDNFPNLKKGSNDKVGYTMKYIEHSAKSKISRNHGRIAESLELGDKARESKRNALKDCGDK